MLFGSFTMTSVLAQVENCTCARKDGEKLAAL